MSNSKGEMMDLRKLVRVHTLMTELGHTEVADALEELKQSRAALDAAPSADFETWARSEFGCGFDGDDYLFVRGDEGFEDDRVAGAWAAWQHLTAAAPSGAQEVAK